MKVFPRHRALLAIIGLSPLLVQCLATSEDLRNVDLRLRTLNNKLISTDRNVSDLQTEAEALANKASVDNLQKNLADTANTSDTLKTQLLQVKGQIEENAHRIEKLQEDEKFYREGQSNRSHDLNEGLENLRSTLEELQNRLTALEKKSQADNATLQSLNSDVERFKEARAGEAAERARKAAEEAARAAREAEEARTAKAAEDPTAPQGAENLPARSSEEPRVLEPAQSKRNNEATVERPAKTAAPDKKKPTAADKKKDAAEKKKASSEKAAPGENTKGEAVGDPARNLYEEGMTAFSAKKFPEAQAAFKRYLDKYPQGELAANARFWLGDCFYNQREYEAAILEFQRCIADYPRNAKSAATLLKQGMAFEQIKEYDTAKLIFLKLTTDYPNSDEAAAAQKRLESLK